MNSVFSLAPPKSFDQSELALCIRDQLFNSVPCTNNIQDMSFEHRTTMSHECFGINHAHDVYHFRSLGMQGVHVCTQVNGIAAITPHLTPGSINKMNQRGGGKRAVRCRIGGDGDQCG